MAGLTDAPTLFRTGSPSLGPPVIDIPQPQSVDLLGPMLRRLDDYAGRLQHLEAPVWVLQQPWYRRLWSWVRS